MGLKGNNILVFNVFTLVFFNVNILLGQIDSTQLHENVKVYKSFNPQIIDAQKINELPRLDDSLSRFPTFNYSIFSKPLKTEFELTPLSPAKIKRRDEIKLPPFYSKIGLGIAALPIAEFGYSSPQDYNYKYGIFLKHYGLYNHVTLEDENSTNAHFMENGINLFGGTIFADKELNLHLNYHRLNYRYYGFPNIYENKQLPKPTEQAVDNPQYFNILETNIQYRRNNTDNDKLHYDIKPYIKYFNNRDNITENQWGFAINISKNINSVLSEIGIDFRKFDTKGIENYKTITHTSTDQDIFFLKLSPQITSTSNSWFLNVGADINFLNSNQTNNIFELYPSIYLSYNIYEDIVTPYFGITGELKTNNYSEIMLENRYIHPYLTLTPTNENIKLFTGIKGQFTKFASYNFLGNLSSVENIYFFKTDSLYNKFKAVTDKGEIYNLKGELSIGIRNNLNVLLNYNLYHYRLNILDDKPLNKPKHEFNAIFDYLYKQNWKFNLTFFNIGKRYVSHFSNITQLKTLDPIFDLNFKTQYNYTKSLSFFIDLNNILNSKYFEFNGYPLVGFNTVMGITFVY